MVLRSLGIQCVPHQVNSSVKIQNTPELLALAELLLHINQAIWQPSRNISTMRFKFGNSYMGPNSNKKGINCVK